MACHCKAKLMNNELWITCARTTRSASTYNNNKKWQICTHEKTAVTVTTITDDKSKHDATEACRASNCCYKASTCSHEKHVNKHEFRIYQWQSYSNTFYASTTDTALKQIDYARRRVTTVNFGRLNLWHTNTVSTYATSRADQRITKYYEYLTT
jgi:hypothetical protein